jgi:Pyruvate/2-oxoacid:ferredoxin oxidoreductase delta subunit
MNERPVAYIEQSTCDGCSSCTVSHICPKDAVVLDPAGVGPAQTARHSRNPFRSLLGEHRPHAWRVDESKCSGCLLCAPYCPHKAVVPRERGKAA